MGRDNKEKSEEKRAKHSFNKKAKPRRMIDENSKKKNSNNAIKKSSTNYKKNKNEKELKNISKKDFDIENNNIVKDDYTENLLDRKYIDKSDNKNRKQNQNKDNKRNNKGNINKKNKKKMNIVLKIMLIILITLLLIAVGIFGKYLYNSKGNIAEAVKSMVKDAVGEQDPIFVLILGVSDDISAELTDTIMLAGYNPDTNQAFLLSIPRDTFIGNNEATAGGFDKINALYQKDPQKTVKAVEKLTGVNIDYYITVKNQALVDIVNSIGGVEFDVPINMDYDDSSQNLHIHLKSGYQKLNGDQAEQLVRFRHNNNGTTYSASYGDNDEGRMRTQREFLKVVATKVIKTNNLEQLKNVVSAVFNNLETNITLNKMLGYAPFVIDFNINDLQMEQLPGDPSKMNELWFYKADTDETRELINGYIEKMGLTEADKKKCLNDYTKKSTTTKKNTNTTNTKKNTVTNTTKNTVTNQNNNTTNNIKKNTVNTTNNTNKLTNNTVKNENVVKNNVTNNVIENKVTENSISNNVNDVKENIIKNNTSSNNIKNEPKENNNKVTDTIDE